ncbi:MAG TPA: hypothetical protein VNJ71_13725 [Gemmatimonadales bacterium]|nr:hypothetical protein [Gemmatimonadales bacterium]
MRTASRPARTIFLEHLPLVAALAVVLVAASYVNLHKSIWLDETFTLDRTRSSLSETLHLARHQSLKPPLYFVLVYYWRQLSPTIEFTRLFSTLCIMGAVVVFHRLSGLFQHRAPWLSLGLLAAVTPHFLWAAAEARPYALAVLCLTAAVYCFTRLWVTGTEHPVRDTIGFVLAGYAALLTFYYTGFVLAALFLAGLVARRDLRRLVWCGVALAVLLLPWIPNISEALSSQAGSYLLDVEARAQPDRWGPAAPAVWLVRRIPAMIFRATPFLTRSWAEPLFWLLLGGLLAARLATGRPRWSGEDTVFAVLGLGGFGALAGLRLLNLTTVDERHWIVAVPGLLVLIARLAGGIRSDSISRAAGVSLLGFFAVAALSFVRNEQGSADWKSATAAVMESERPGEPIVVFLTSHQPFLYYYHGPNEVRRIPPAYASPSRDPGLMLAPADLNRLLRHLSGSATGRFWVVEREWVGSGVDVFRRQIGPVEVLDQRAFHRIRVYRLRRGVGRLPPDPSSP